MSVGFTSVNVVVTDKLNERRYVNGSLAKRNVELLYAIVSSISQLFQMKSFFKSLKLPIMRNSQNVV